MDGVSALHTVAIKVKIPQNRARGKKSARFSFSHPLVKVALILFLVITLAGLAFFSYYYVKYDRIVEARIRGPIFSTSAKIYARPPVVSVGDRYSRDELIAEIRRAGYSETNSKVGTYRETGNSVEVKPGPLSYH